MLTSATQSDNSNGHPSPLEATGEPPPNSVGASLLAQGADLWSAAAPPRVREAAALGGPDELWRQWAKHLSKRNLPRPPHKLLAGGRQALGWGLETRLGLSDREQLARRAAEIAKAAVSAQSSASERINTWLDSVRQSLEVAGAIEALAWACALPKLASQVDSDTWWRLQTELASIAAESSESPADDPLVYQLAAGELALTLAYLLPELTSCRNLASAGLKVVTDCLAEILDGEGLPNCRHLDSLRGLLSCWTRCRVLGLESPELAWDVTTQTQYCWVVRNAVRLARRDGSQRLSESTSAPGVWKLLKAARRLAMDDEADRLFDLTFNKQGRPIRDKKPSREKNNAQTGPARPAPAAESEWSELTLMRGDWSSSSPVLAVAYGGKQIRCELSVGGELVGLGSWTTDLHVAGVRCEQLSAWEQVCWVSDEDVDYLELEAKFTGDIRVQRQILLGRKDRFLLLADAVLGGQSDTLMEHAYTFPLASDVRFAAGEETREGHLVGLKPRGVALPLALPEWRSDTRGGSLTAVDGGLRLSHSVTGQCLFAPLFIGLDRKWLGKELTWRQLTVAELRVVQPRDVAVGYRAQIGSLQWLVYRSLSRAGTRTVLSQNIASEFLVGRFHKSGKFDTYLDIEY